ncbi:MAG TPA: protein-glutamate O-methyltransferase CheR [Patescibacteria group bacterium]|nr:protein-glutamate O-methyltransferase CheR [Patescibacteria group bacterium]
MGLTLKEFQLFQSFIEKRCGIVIDVDRLYWLESRLRRIVEDNGLENFCSLYEQIWRPEGSALAQRMIDAITVNETYWFRERAPWAVLETQLLPQYLRQLRDGSRQRVRIWSAACSSGQEPYSVAMWIHHFLQCREATDLYRDRFEIVATDISQAALTEAQRGCYDVLAMNRGLDAALKKEYFGWRGQQWQINEGIRQAVEFRSFNLQQPFDTLGSFDVIFLRYVAIYFAGSTRRQLMEKMAAALVDDGVLFLGGSEVMLGYKDLFEQKSVAGGAFYRKKADNGK